ncbi:MAG: glucosyltransferase domain-containing protein [Bacteroidales bacterium]|jgi:hypothetical protein|nr:glucosyltransferase domain-containing protein [Bacteroidales bacterium]
MNVRNLKIGKIIGIISLFALAVCFALLLPQVRETVIRLSVQTLLHREVNYADMWMSLVFIFSLRSIFVILLIDFCTLTAKGRAICKTVAGSVVSTWRTTDWRAMYKPFFIMLGVYWLGILSIIRANFHYIDDMGRIVDGSSYPYGFSRHVSNFLSALMHADVHVTDISPLLQLLGAALLAGSSVLLVYILCDGKIRTAGLLASVPLGLSPYFLECMSFKFDTPYMALSVLASIFPFLFIRSKPAFTAWSVASLLVMCMTYQASSGIYVMLALTVCFREWENTDKTCREILSLLGIAALSFGIAMLVFRVLLEKQFEDQYYVGTSMFPLPELLPGVLANLKKYIMLINSDFGVVWKTLTGVVCLLFVCGRLKTGARKPLYAVPIATIVLMLSGMVSFGVYSVLQQPLFEPRAMLGFGALLAMICICVTERCAKTGIISVLALNWSLFVFAFSYGNALADQLRYTNFRTEILLEDLSRLFPEKNLEDTPVQIKNAIGFAPSVKNIARRNPVIERLVPQFLREGNSMDAWSDYYLLQYFHWNAMPEKDDDFEAYRLPVALDSYYHTVRSDGERILIVLKN